MKVSFVNAVANICEQVGADVNEGFRISAYDPAAIGRAKAVLTSSSIRFAEDAYDAAHNADALLILTD